MLEDVESKLTNGNKVDLGIVLSGTAEVIFEVRIQPPVQAILNPPVQPSRLHDPLGTWGSFLGI